MKFRYQRKKQESQSALLAVKKENFHDKSECLHFISRDIINKNLFQFAVEMKHGQGWN